MIRVELYEVARRLAGRSRLEVEARTLGEALREVGRRAPALEGVVVREGRLAPHWRASLDGRRFLEDPDATLPDGSSLLLLSALAGG